MMARRDSPAQANASRKKLPSPKVDPQDVVWVLDSVTMRYLYISPSVRELSGYSPEEVLASEHATELMPESAKQFAALIAKRSTDYLSGACVPAQFYVDELLHPCKDGRQLWTEVVTTYVLNAHTGHVEVHGLTRNIAERKRLLRQLEQSHDLLSRISSQVPGILFQYLVSADGKGCFPYISDAVQTLYGLDPLALRESDAPMWGLLEPTEVEDFRRSMQASLQAMGPWHYECQMRTLNDGWRWQAGDARPVQQKDGSVVYYGYLTDITARKQSEEELQLAALVYQNSNEAMFVAAADGKIVTVNPAFSAMSGYSQEEAFGRSAQFLNPVSQNPETYAEVQRGLRTLGYWHGEILSQRKSGEIYPVSASVNTIYAANGKPYRYVSLFSDITHRKQSEEIIWRQANFDALTGLPNRRMFYDRVDQEIKKAIRSGLDFALLFIDLDHFKEVNDTLGHDVGDQLLVEAAQRIRSCVRDTDTVARLGGDEFTVLLAGIRHQDTQVVERIARTILSKLVAPFQLQGEEVFISASIGVTLYPNDAKAIDELFRNADQAMYAAKNQGRNRYSFFTPELQMAAQARLRLINDMRSALSEQQFKIYYQPVVDLLTGRIVKAEALIRWRHSQRGDVSPAEFIPLAESSGLIHEIGEWVFREAAQWAKRWRQVYSNTFQISINKSPIQFYKDAVGHKAWLAYLRELDLPGETLVIEITEGMLLEADTLIQDSLLGLRDAGIQVAIDDFGTGYSSLAYLKKFDIDYLKIDQSFTRNIAPNSSDLALSEAIVVMAHKLGLKVIAEGVETVEQRDLLVAMGCDYVQGYLFSKAVPPDEFENLLLQYKDGFPR